MDRFPILHSGFIARIDTHLRKSEPVVNPYVESLLFRKSGSNDFSNLFYNEEIHTLYKEMMNNPSVLKNFEFRERILKVAALMLGRGGLQDWLDIQNKYARVATWHLEFIIDTVKYIGSGKRSTELSIIEPLILKVPNGATMNLERNEELRVLIKEGKEYLGGMISPVLNQWVSHRGGYMDLLYTLWLIFGDRSYAHKSIAA